MVPSFGIALGSRLKALGWSHREFARRSGRSHGFIDFIVNGASGGPDESEVEAWAALLGIEGQQREEFLLAAAWSRTPRRVKEHIWQTAPSLFTREPRLESAPARRVATSRSSYRVLPDP